MSTPQTITIQEQNALLEALIVTQGTLKQRHRGVRNTCITLCMLDAGLRVGEVVQLRVSALWFKDEPVTSLLIMSEKTRNEESRQIPLSTRLAEAVKEMGRCFWTLPDTPRNPYAFYQTDGDTPMTTRQVERIIRSAAIAAIGRPVHPHVLRHTFASKLMRVTDMRTVQLLLGHKNLASTQVYLHPNGDDLRKAINDAETPRQNEVS